MPPAKRKPMSEQDVAALAEGVTAGNRRILAQAITLIESTRVDDRAAASALLERLMPSAGIPRPMGSDILLPLIQGTLQNVKIFDTGKALTGPLTRGDGETIKHHLKALQDHPSALLVYREMSKSALSIAHTEEKISSRKYRQIMALLADK